MAFVKIATLQEIPEGKAKQYKLKNQVIALFHVNGNYFAVDDTCPHRGAPLWEGEVEGTEVTCPWHGASFDLASGAHLCPPARSGIKTYPVKINGNDIEIDLP